MKNLSKYHIGDAYVHALQIVHYVRPIAVKAYLIN